MRIVIFVLFLVSAGGVYADPDFGGTWVINQEETDKLAVDFEKGGGIKKRGGGQARPQVSVGGLPGLPPIFGKARPGPQSPLAARDPDVLRCNTMTIEQDSDKLQLFYDDFAKERVFKGTKQGRTGKWSDDRIQQKYKSTERTVTKTWEMREDGRLLVTVKVNPRGDKSRTLKRVFDRKAPDAADEAEPESAQETTASS